MSNNRELGKERYLTHARQDSGAQMEVGSLCYKWVSWDIDFEVEISKQGFTREHLIRGTLGISIWGGEQQEGSRVEQRGNWPRCSRNEASGDLHGHCEAGQLFRVISSWGDRARFLYPHFIHSVAVGSPRGE